jgi:hypothetical protein
MISKNDLVVLVADTNMEQTFKGLLARHRSLGIRAITYNIYKHPRHDPGCRNEGHDFLRIFAGQYDYALVLFDHEGCGKEDEPPDDLEKDLEKRLASNGWHNRSKVIILRPELEIWVWSDSPRVDECLGWAGRRPSLRAWLHDEGLWEPDVVKPDDPKLAVEKALREVRLPRSSSIYRQLAERVPLERCTDASFRKLRETLQQWFPPPDD